MPDPDLGRMLLEASRALGAEVVTDLAEKGWDDARPGHAAVFQHIDRRSGTRLVDLAEKARMTKQGMTLLVDELEERGYVRRVEDPDDARVRIVRLTAKGRRYAADVRRALVALEARARRDLGERRFDTFREAVAFLADGTRQDGFDEDDTVEDQGDPAED